MNRVEIKEEAKKTISGNRWNWWKGALIVFGVTFVIALVAGIIAAAIGGEDNAAATSIIQCIVSLAILPLTVGFTAYTLKIARKESFEIKDLTKYYPFFVKILLIDILVGLLVALGSILFIIPGIILAFAYSMVFFCFIDNTDIGVTEALQTSREMMKGYKFDFFVFNLSFLGWIILAGLTFGILYIWLAPYMATAEALYYDKLASKTK